MSEAGSSSWAGSGREEEEASGEREDESVYTSGTGEESCVYDDPDANDAIMEMFTMPPRRIRRRHASHSRRHAGHSDEEDAEDDVDSAEEAEEEEDEDGSDEEESVPSSAFELDEEFDDGPTYHREKTVMTTIIKRIKRASKVYRRILDRRITPKVELANWAGISLQDMKVLQRLLSLSNYLWALLLKFMEQQRQKKLELFRHTINVDDDPFMPLVNTAYKNISFCELMESLIEYDFPLRMPTAEELTEDAAPELWRAIASCVRTVDRMRNVVAVVGCILVIESNEGFTTQPPVPDLCRRVADEARRCRRLVPLALLLASLRMEDGAVGEVIAQRTPRTLFQRHAHLVKYAHEALRAGSSLDLSELNTAPHATPPAATAAAADGTAPASGSVAGTPVPHSRQRSRRGSPMPSDANLAAASVPSSPTRSPLSFPVEHVPAAALPSHSQTTPALTSTHARDGTTTTTTTTTIVAGSGSAAEQSEAPTRHSSASAVAPQVLGTKRQRSPTADFSTATTDAPARAPKMPRLEEVETFTLHRWVPRVGDVIGRGPDFLHFDQTKRVDYGYVVAVLDDEVVVSWRLFDDYVLSAYASGDAPADLERDRLLAEGAHRSDGRLFRYKWKAPFHEVVSWDLCLKTETRPVEKEDLRLIELSITGVILGILCNDREVALLSLQYQSLPPIMSLMRSEYVAEAAAAHQSAKECAEWLSQEHIRLQLEYDAGRGVHPENNQLYTRYDVTLLKATSRYNKVCDLCNEAMARLHGLLSHRRIALSFVQQGGAELLSRYLDVAAFPAEQYQVMVLLGFLGRHNVFGEVLRRSPDVALHMMLQALRHTSADTVAPLKEWAVSFLTQVIKFPSMLLHFNEHAGATTMLRILVNNVEGSEQAFEVLQPQVQQTVMGCLTTYVIAHMMLATKVVFRSHRSLSALITRVSPDKSLPITFSATTTSVVDSFMSFIAAPPSRSAADSSSAAQIDLAPSTIHSLVTGERLPRVRDLITGGIIGWLLRAVDFYMSQNRWDVLAASLQTLCTLTVLPFIRPLLLNPSAVVASSTSGVSSVLTVIEYFCTSVKSRENHRIAHMIPTAATALHVLLNVMHTQEFVSDGAAGGAGAASSGANSSFVSGHVSGSLSGVRSSEDATSGGGRERAADGTVTSGTTPSSAHGEQQESGASMNANTEAVARFHHACAVFRANDGIRIVLEVMQLPPDSTLSGRVSFFPVVARAVQLVCLISQVGDARLLLEALGVCAIAQELLVSYADAQREYLTLLGPRVLQSELDPIGRFVDNAKSLVSCASGGAAAALAASASTVAAVAASRGADGLLPASMMLAGGAGDDMLTRPLFPSPAVEMEERQAIVNRATIDYSQESLMELIASHLESEGLRQAAATVRRHAGLDTGEGTSAINGNGVTGEGTTVASASTAVSLREPAPTRSGGSGDIANSQPSLPTSTEGHSILDEIVKSYLRQQQATSANPIETVPQLDLRTKHVYDTTAPDTSRDDSRNIFNRMLARRTGHKYTLRMQLHDNYVFHRYPTFLFDIICGEEDFVAETIAFCDGGDGLVIGTSEGSLAVFDASPEEQSEQKMLEQHLVFEGEGIAEVRVSDDNRFVSAISEGGTCRVMDRRALPVSVQGFPSCRSLRLSRNSRLAVTTHDHEPKADLYDMETQQLLRSFQDTFAPGENNFNVATFNPASTLVLHDALLWDVRGDRPVMRFDRITESFTSDFHPSGLLAMLDERIWDLRMMRILHTVPVLKGCSSFHVPHLTGSTIYGFRRCTGANGRKSTVSVVDSYSFDCILSEQTYPAFTAFAVDPSDRMCASVLEQDVTAVRVFCNSAVAANTRPAAFSTPAHLHGSSGSSDAGADDRDDDSDGFDSFLSGTSTDALPEGVRGGPIGDDDEEDVDESDEETDLDYSEDDDDETSDDDGDSNNSRSNDEVDTDASTEYPSTTYSIEILDDNDNESGSDAN